MMLAFLLLFVIFVVIMFLIHDGCGCLLLLLFISVMFLAGVGSLFF